MSWRGLVLLILALAAALAVLFWIDRPAGDAQGTGKSLAPLVTISPERIQAVEIQHGQIRCRIERKGSAGWTLVQPVLAEADPRPIENLLKSLSEARVLRIVEERAKDLSRFGLDPSESMVRLIEGKAAAPVLLRIGRASPVGFERYAALKDDTVVLVDGSLGSALERDPLELRERRAFPVEPEKIRRIVLERRLDSLVLVRDGSEWKMEIPVRDRADFTSVDALTSALAALSFHRFLDNGEGAKAEAGLSPPTLVVGVLGQEAGALQRLEIGEHSQGDQRYARRAAFPRLGVVETASLMEFERDADEFRDRRMAFLSSPDVREIRCVVGDTDFRAWRAKEGGPWSVQQGGGSIGAGDAAKIEAALDHVRWLRALSFPKMRGSWTVSRSIMIRGESGELGRLEIGSESPTPGEAQGREHRAGAVPVQSSWRPGVRVLVSADSVADLPRTSGDLLPSQKEPSSPGKLP